MVRALLAGTKTQTRRACKPQPPPNATADVHNWRPESPYGVAGDCLWVRETFFAYGRWETRFNDKTMRDEMRFVDMTTASGLAYQYDADGPALPLACGRKEAVTGWYKRPALFMPRVASRILLEIMSVRVERLNACSAADAIAEGVQGARDGIGWNAGGGEAYGVEPVEAYAAVWEMINGKGIWQDNPWVWVVEFRRG